ncbi:MAG: cupredoxin domain-containing protein [Dehalococcoidia bacterium]
MRLGATAARIVAGTTLALIVGISGAGQPARAQDGALVVRLVGDHYLPDTITAPVGATVTWSNDESDPTNEHNVIAPLGGFSSPNFLPGTTWSYTFTSPGEYGYFCDLHEGMIGRVIVQ